MHSSAVGFTAPSNPRPQFPVPFLHSPAQQCRLLPGRIATPPGLYVWPATTFQRRNDGPHFPQQHGGDGGECPSVGLEWWAPAAAQRRVLDDGVTFVWRGWKPWGCPGCGSGFSWCVFSALLLIAQFQCLCTEYGGAEYCWRELAGDVFNFSIYNYNYLVLEELYTNLLTKIPLCIFYILL